MKILNVLMFAASFALCGCSLTNEVYFTPFSNEGAAKYAPTDPASVRIYSTKLPDKPYEELGIMTLKSMYVPDNRSSIYERFRKAAASVGANAILLLPDSSVNDSIPVVTRYGTYYDSLGDSYIFSATAVRVEE